jgi:uncharacterized membrane protein
MYLSSKTPCDLSFANHPCARFFIDPRTSHATALKHIGCYLLGTRTQGTIEHPTDHLSFHHTAEANFAGMFSSMHPEDPKSVKSQAGSVILLGSIPIAWSNKFQMDCPVNNVFRLFFCSTAIPPCTSPTNKTLDYLPIPGH